METQTETETKQEAQSFDGQLVRLPLWKACLDDMLKEGVKHGQTYPAEFFEQRLRCQRDSMQFGLGVSEIRRGLEEQGYYLSGRGQNGNQFVILEPQCNRDVMASYQRSALDALKRSVVLGSKTRLELLAEADRLKHEKETEKAATRLCLMRRSATIAKIVAKASPKLLER